MKKREVHIVGNWKMNQSLHEISQFFIEMTKNATRFRFSYTCIKKIRVYHLSMCIRR